MKLFGFWESGEQKMSKWVFPNGTYYQGAFTNNKPNGQGTWFFENGNQVAGSFQQKKIEP